jgi:hypothetical protein
MNLLTTIPSDICPNLYHSTKQHVGRRYVLMKNQIYRKSQVGLQFCQPSILNFFYIHAIQQDDMILLTRNQIVHSTRIFLTYIFYEFNSQSSNLYYIIYISSIL